jgi:predicted nucleotidyltransferase
MNETLNDSKALEREKRLKQELKRYLDLLIKYEEPEKIILFGSLVTGQIHEWSDIDILIIKRTELPFFQRLHKVRELLHPRVGTDILVYTPEEFEKMSQERLFVKEEILGKGVVIYEQNSGILVDIRP